jgi:hypothetical protein
MIVTVIVLLVFSFCISCRKMPNYMGTATIVGFDFRKAICTGGVYLKIDGHPNSNDPANGLYDIESVPAPYQLSNFTNFPIRIRLDWKINTKCSGNYVDIIQMKVID